MDPAEGELVARHLHPNRVDRVGGNGTDVGHHQMFVLSEREGVDQREHRHGLIAGSNFRRKDVRHGHHLVLLLENYQRVATDDEIIALRVMVSGVERDGIELLLGEIPSIWRDRALIVAGSSE